MATELSHLKTGLYYEAEPICFNNSNMCIYTVNGMIPYHNFEQEQEKNLSLSSSYFFTHLLSITKPSLLYIKNVNDNAGYIAYLKPLRFMNGLNERSVIAVLISEEIFFQEIIECTGHLLGDLYMYTSVQQMIVEKHLSEGAAPPKQKVLQLKGIGAIHSEPGQVIFREKSEKYGITYVLAIAASAFYTSADAEGTGLLIILILFVLSCMLLLIFISKQNYKPIHSLAVDIAGENFFVDKADVISFIREKYDQTVTEKLTLHEQLDEQLKIIRNQLCVRLLCGQLKSKTELEHLAQCTGFPINFSYCAVLYLLSSGKDTQKKLVDYLADLASIKKEWLIGEPLHEEGICIIVAFNLTSASSPTDTLYSIAKDLYDTLLGAGILQNQHLYIGVGKWKSSLLALNDSYLESIAVLHYLRDNVKSGFYLYEQESFDSLEHNESWTALFSLLWESIKRGETTAVQNVFSDILKHLCTCPKAIQLLRYSELLSLLEKRAAQVNFRIDLQKLSLMLLNESFDSFATNVLAIMIEMCNEISRSIAQSDSALRNDLLEYISQHCFDGDFSLSSVTDALHLSKVKVNTILQEEIGMTFSSYVSHLRLDRFCDQLLHTEKSIQTIVTEIGYYDVSSFLRKFKSMKGMTAGQYRSKWRE